MASASVVMMLSCFSLVSSVFYGNRDATVCLRPNLFDLVDISFTISMIDRQSNISHPLKNHTSISFSEPQR